MKILITGVAGFIGCSIAKYYSRKNKIKIIGIDNFSKYSGKDIKNLRINILKKNKNFKFLKCDINNQNKIKTLFKKNKFEIVIHLAAKLVLDIH